MEVEIKLLLNIFKQANIKNTVIRILQSDTTKKYILDIIHSRIKDEGTDIFGNKLSTDFGISQSTRSGYSKKTEKLKNANHVDLFDSGDMFNSIKLEDKNYGLNIKVDFKKDGGSIYDNFQDSFQNEKMMKDEVINLSQEDKENLINSLLIKLIYNDINNQISNI